MAINQAYLFLIFTLNGIFIGLLFDFFRILRKSFKTTNLITYIEDILFWVISGISIIFSMYKFSGGVLRIFMFLGIIFGIVIYILTFSSIIIKTFVFMITLVKNFFTHILKIVCIPFKFISNLMDKFIFRPLYLLIVKFKIFFTKKTKKINIVLKNTTKLEKNVKKL